MICDLDNKIFRNAETQVHFLKYTIKSRFVGHQTLDPYLRDKKNLMLRLKPQKKCRVTFHSDTKVLTQFNNTKGVTWENNSSTEKWWCCE